MGLFDKKPTEFEYDGLESANKKTKMRQIFNEAVVDGNTFEILHATKTNYQPKSDLAFSAKETNDYIIGYRSSDNCIIMLEINNDLTKHGNPQEVNMAAIIGASYDPKTEQVSLIYKQGYNQPNEVLNIKDTGSKTFYGISNIVQKEERDKFLGFLEKLRANLENQGYKQDKWL